MTNPNVSIVLPSYNHEKFILEALDSICQQTYRDFEIIILDDASTDNSVKAIRDFIETHPDVPVTFSVHEANQGGVITLNHLIEQARGNYIALLNSDDLWASTKLEQQVAFLEAHPEVGAVFTQALIVDQNKEKPSTDVLPEVVQGTFLQENRSRGKWFRRFFFEQNCLCHPSILIRKRVYDDIGLYDPRFRQIPDLNQWVRFLKKYSFHLIEEPLVMLRWHQTNTSVINSSNSIRGLNELFYLYRGFFDGMPDDVFIDGFGDLFRDPGANTPEALECEKAFLFFQPKSFIQAIYHNIGLEKLYSLLGSPTTRKVLEDQYHFTYNDFFQLGGGSSFDGALFQAVSQPPAPAVIPEDVPASIPVIVPAAQPSGIKFAIGEMLNKYPPLYNFARIVYRTITGKAL